MFDLVDLVEGALDLAISSDRYKVVGWLLLNVFFTIAVYYLCFAALETRSMAAALHSTPLASLNREYLALGSAVATLIPFNVALWRFSSRWG